MSEESVRTVRRALELSQGGVWQDDPGAAFDECVREGILAPNVVCKAGLRGGTGVAGIDDFVGRDGFVDFMQRWTEDFDQFEIEPEEIIDAENDRVVAITRQHGIGKGSGAPVEFHPAVLCTLLEGRIVRVDVFIHPTPALRAAGLRE